MICVHKLTYACVNNAACAIIHRVTGVRNCNGLSILSEAKIHKNVYTIYSVCVFAFCQSSERFSSR